MDILTFPIIVFLLIIGYYFVIIYTIFNTSFSKIYGPLLLIFKKIIIYSALIGRKTHTDGSFT